MMSVESGVKYLKLSPFPWSSKLSDVRFGIIKFGLNCKALNFKPVAGDLNLRTRNDFWLDCSHDFGGGFDFVGVTDGNNPANDDRTTELIPSAATINAPVYMSPS
jgi:hypothetical protein